MPIYLYHRGCFLEMLGMREEAHRLFNVFIKKQSEYKADDISRLFDKYEGTDVEKALAHASGEV